ELMLEIGGDPFVPERRRYVVDLVALVMRGIVDEDCDRPERTAHLLDGALERRDVRHIAMLVVDRCRRSEIGLQLPRRLVRDVEKSNFCALRREGAHDGLANAHGAAGNERDPALEARITRSLPEAFICHRPCLTALASPENTTRASLPRSAAPVAPALRRCALPSRASGPRAWSASAPPPALRRPPGSRC